MLAVINQVGTLIIVMIIGVIAAKVGYMTDKVRKKLSDILLNIVAPLYAIKSFQMDTSPELMSNLIIVVVSAFLIISVGTLAGKFLWRKAPEDKRAILVYTSGFPNCGYLGYPLLGGLFGDEAIIYVAMFVMVFTIMFWTVGVRIHSKKVEKWYVPLTRPGLIFTIIGLILFVAQIKLPYFLFNAFSMVGSMTSPLAMMLIGAFLAEVHFREVLKDKYVYLLSGFKLIIMPLITYTILSLFHIEGLVLTVIVMISSMPAAINTVILATKFGENAKFGSAVVSVSTLLALISLPIWLSICS